jgi:hypothetical protein
MERFTGMRGRLDARTFMRAANVYCLEEHMRFCD